MLELQRLLLQANSATDPSSNDTHSTAASLTGTVTIFDPNTESKLGIARPLSVRWWRRWFTPNAMEVCETEDLSLVFTLQRSWWLVPRWIIRDAEERRIGTLVEVPRWLQLGIYAREPAAKHFHKFHGILVEDPFGRCLALLGEKREGEALRFLAPDGLELGSLSGLADGVVVTFAARLNNSPFVKMMLLAAALVRGRRKEASTAPSEG